MITINPRRIKYYCELPENKFCNLIPYNDVGEYWYKDNNSNILGVGHLDSVYPHRRNCAIGYVGGRLTVISSSLDDRLGVYLLLDVLPVMGLTYDVLLTTHEESGHSTGINFTPPPGKQYNFIFELDRQGTDDCALYQYYTSNLVAKLKEFGFNGVQGSYTDITSMNLGCVGFNFSVGYHGQHMLGCYAHVDDIQGIIPRVTRFIRDNQYTFYPYTPAPIKVYTPSIPYKWERSVEYSTGNHDEAYWRGVYVKCDICQARDSTVHYSRTFRNYL